jgi:glycosyltransferase involved in cell wall biosynthesis
VEHLHALQPQHDVVLLTKPERMEYLRGVAPSFTVEVTPYREFTFAEQLGFRKQLQALQADLVHFGMVQQPVLYRGKVVTTMHDLTTVRFKNPAKNPVVFWAKQQVYRWVNKKVARKSAAIITPTEFVKNDVVQFAHIDPTKVTVTLEAADVISEPAEPVAGLENTQFIMYIGRPTPHKNLERLIEAYAEIQKTHPDLKLVLAGKKDALYEAHAERAETKGIQGIVFTGFVSDGQLRWLYEHCAAYVFPSLSEGFGLPGLEAMAHGAPVVSSNATCLPEVYGSAAKYFNPLDVADMAVKIVDVLDDPLQREDLIAKGKQHAATFSWARMAEQTLTVYESVLEGE